MLNIFKNKEDKKAEPMAFIFIGRSGCGKGTQVELFKKSLGERTGSKILHIETGAFFREFIKGDSYTQSLSKKVVESGGLMPGAMALDLWVNYLVKNFSGKENLLFDGAPRIVYEAELLDAMLKFYGIPNYKVIYINTSRKWCTDRLTARGRKDDTAEGIDKRMSWFEKDVLPCIDFFNKDKDCQVFDINGEQTIEAVHKELIEKVLG
ncbi:MAG: nucleoside monophosphate kinase [Candidatus Paceibacterota bacterium]|jgi:adenylate kinase family enzyme